MREPLWVDGDRDAFAPRPAAHFDAFGADAVDATVLRPLADLWAYEEPREAIDVNALDEVPSSSGRENRIGRTDLRPRRR